MSAEEPGLIRRATLTLPRDRRASAARPRAARHRGYAGRWGPLTKLSAVDKVAAIALTLAVAAALGGAAASTIVPGGNAATAQTISSGTPNLIVHERLSGRQSTIKAGDSRAQVFDVENTGTRPATLAIKSEIDGNLAAVMTASITDITDLNTPVTMYNGPLIGMGFAPIVVGEGAASHRVYRVVMTLPASVPVPAQGMTLVPKFKFLMAESVVDELREHRPR